MNNGFDWKTWRIPGVLMRFAVAYLVVGLVILFVPKWPWDWTYMIYRRLSGACMKRCASFWPLKVCLSLNLAGTCLVHKDSPSLTIKRSHFAADAINFEDTDTSEEALSRNSSFAEEPKDDERRYEQMMKVRVI